MPSSARAVELDVKRRVLPNGLTVLILENHAAPTFCYLTAFRVGSRNERPGITGISHLFEHMMFNGSDRYAPKEFDRIIESSGGYSNGSTWYDTTTYFEEVASDSLDTILELESDRMRSLRITPENLEQERSIVKEERRLRTDNSTEGTMFELLMANAFMASPYRWPVVGWEVDLDSISLDDCRDYFRTYYAPGNAIVVIAGDVRAETAFALVEERFGGIPAQPPPRAVVDAEPPQKGEKRIVHRMAAELPAVMIGQKAPALLEPDFPALDVARCILNEGDSSRLYRTLIYEKQIAAEASAYFRASLDRTLFVVYAQAKEGVEAAEVEKATVELLGSMADGKIDDRDVAKAKNQIRAETVRDLKDNAGRAEVIASYERLTGDWRTFYTMTERIEAVTREQVAEACARCFDPDRRTVVTLAPTEAD